MHALGSLAAVYPASAHPANHFLLTWRASATHHPAACSGAVQAGFIAYLLFLASRGVDAFFDARPPPDAAINYTTHNVAVLVQVRPAQPACCRAAMPLCW